MSGGREWEILAGGGNLCSSLLLAPCSLLLTACSLIPTPGSRILTLYSRLLTPYSQLPTPYSLLPAPDSRLPLPAPDSLPYRYPCPQAPPLTTKTSTFSGCIDHIWCSHDLEVEAVLDMPYRPGAC